MINFLLILFPSQLFDLKYIDKVLSFTEKKYAIVINIWKVFSILLEYCCRTDYRMLISEISKEN
jgi:hypothetical protein